MGLTKGIHHVHVKCKPEQNEEVLRFYRDTLGLEVYSVHGESTILGSGGEGVVEVFCDAEETLGQGDIRHFAFAVDNVDECIKTVEAAGYKIKEYPVNVMFGLKEDTPARIAFCYGALGEEIEFFQVRKA